MHFAQQLDCGGGTVDHGELWELLLRALQYVCIKCGLSVVHVRVSGLQLPTTSPCMNMHFTVWVWVMDVGMDPNFPVCAVPEPSRCFQNVQLFETN